MVVISCVFYLGEWHETGVIVGIEEQAVATDGERRIAGMSMIGCENLMAAALPASLQSCPVAKKASQHRVVWFIGHLEMLPPAMSGFHPLWP